MSDTPANSDPNRPPAAPQAPSATGGFRKPITPAVDEHRAPTDPGATWANIRIVRPPGPRPPTPGTPPEPVTQPPPTVAARLQLRPMRSYDQTAESTPPQGQPQAEQMQQAAPVIPLKPLPPQQQPLEPAAARPENSFRSAPTLRQAPTAPQQRQPPPQAEQRQPTMADAGFQSRSGRAMTLKREEVLIPPEIATPPPQIRREVAPAILADISRRVTAIVLALAAMALLTAGPILAQWPKDRALATQEITMTGATALIIALLLLLRKPAATAFAAMIISYHIIYSLLIAVAPQVVLDILPTRIPWMTATGTALGAAMLFGGAFLLSTGRGPVIWAFAALAAMGGAALPFLPVSEFLTKDLGLTLASPSATKPKAAASAEPAAPAAGATAAVIPPGTRQGRAVISTSAFSVIVPEGWQQRNAPTASRSGDLCMIGPDKTPGLTVLITRSVATAPDPAELAKRHMTSLAAATPGAIGILNGIPGCTDRSRIYMPSGANVQDILVVVKGGIMFMLSCQAPRELWLAHRAELDMIYREFQPR